MVAEPLEQRAGLLASLTLSAAPLTLAFRELLLLGGLARGLAGEGVTWVGAEGPPLAHQLQELLEGVREVRPRAGGLSRQQQQEQFTVNIRRKGNSV